MHSEKHVSNQSSTNSTYDHGSTGFTHFFIKQEELICHSIVIHSLMSHACRFRRSLWCHPLAKSAGADPLPKCDHPLAKSPAADPLPESLGSDPLAKSPGPASHNLSGPLANPANGSIYLTPSRHPMTLSPSRSPATLTGGSSCLCCSSCTACQSRCHSGCANGC